MDLDYKKMLDTLPALIIHAGLTDGKILYANFEAQNALTGFEGGGILDIIEFGPGFGDFDLRSISPGTVLESICKVNEQWYALRFSADAAQDLIIISGVVVNSYMSAGYLEMVKTKDDFLHIYDKKSGISFLDSYTGRLAGDDSQIFTVSYIALDAGELEGTDARLYMKRFSDVVITGIRDTDIFVYMGDMNFMVIFPKCGFKVVENIVATIENKLHILSASDGFEGEDFSFEYAILEITSENVTSSEDILKRLENMIMG